MRHGEANNKNGTRTRLYVIWCHMIERCENEHSERFADYGGRGIRVCEEWKDFVSFRDWALNNGYSKSLTIDRIDNDGNYEPGNCKWSSVKDQCNNRRTNHLLTYKGRTQTMTQWAEELGMNPGTFKYRIYLGWSVERAIETPVVKRGGRV
jgi:hypothetical protein